MTKTIPPSGSTQGRLLAILSSVWEIDILDLASRLYNRCDNYEVNATHLAICRLRKRGYNIQKRPVFPNGFRHSKGVSRSLYRLER